MRPKREHTRVVNPTLYEEYGALAEPPARTPAPDRARAERRAAEIFENLRAIGPSGEDQVEEWLAPYQMALEHLGSVYSGEWTGPFYPDRWSFTEGYPDEAYEEMEMVIDAIVHHPLDLPGTIDAFELSPEDVGDLIYSYVRESERYGGTVPDWLWVQQIADAIYPDPRYGKLELRAVPKEVAYEFVREHHSALGRGAKLPPGLMFALGAYRREAFRRPELVAVALAGHPTGAGWVRRKDCGAEGTLELTRVASIGGLYTTNRKGQKVPLNASSMLTSRMMDLLPVSGRHGVEGCRFVTYSMIDEKGTTYLSLVSKGLRPTKRVRPKKRATGARAGGKGTAKAEVEKIRWEYGPAADPPDWSSLKGVVPDDQVQKAIRAFDRYLERHPEMEGAQMGLRFKNAQGRIAYYDDLTGTVVPGTYEGARESRDRIVRVRPAKGEPYEILPFDPETADPTRDTYGVEPGFHRMYKEEAKAQSKARRRARRRKPLEEHSAPGLREVGVRTTFDSAREAAREFMSMNGHIFESSHFDDIEIRDQTRDFMDAIEVPVGGKRKTVKFRGGERQKVKYAKLAKTPRGQEILEGGGRRSGDGVAREMLVFLFGMAGPRRRYIDVPWDMVTDYTDLIVERMVDEAPWRMETEGPPVAGVTWYPLAAGLWDEEDLVKAAIEEVGYEKGLKLAEWVNSQHLYRMANHLEAIIKPQKGPPGKEGRKRLKCIPKEHRKIIRHRLRQIREWAAYPEGIPEWACDPIQDFEHGNTRVCRFPAIEHDISLIHRACEEPYDPSWPQRLRIGLAAEGKFDESAQYKAGIMPIESYELPEQASSYDLDVPWEQAEGPEPVDEPWLDEPWLDEAPRAANPETRRLRNRLVRY